ncbi:MAG: DUF58 domain-containing protein [Aggregatilineales bacterium]
MDMIQENLRRYRPKLPIITGRTGGFFVGSFVFYLFANQTQIGWLYVVSATLMGLIFAAYVLNRTVLKGIEVTRRLQPETFERYENDDLSITLTINTTRRQSSLQLNITENCLVAPPESDYRDVTMFVPVLPAREGVQFTYNFPIYRRGLYHFPDVQVSSRAPFGLFERKTEIPVKTSLLIYPELRELKCFPLLDKQLAAQLANPRTGIGNEVIGVRPYRPGDSPRHIHWRSVARTNRLISKEFAEETQPGLTLILDRHCPLNPLPETKHTPFEMAVKAAVSIADYALRQRYPLHLLTSTDDSAAPSGELSRDVLLQYMARVQPQNNPVLPELLKQPGLQQYVAVVMAWADMRVLDTLLSLQAQGAQVLVILPDVGSFPIDVTDTDTNTLMAALASALIPVRVLRHEDDWSLILSHDPEVG